MIEKGISSSDTIHFENVELSTQFQYLGLGDFSKPRFDAEHLSKRRKISSNNLLGEIIKEVYFLLGSQKVLDLDGLSQVIGYIISIGHLVTIY